MPATGVIRARRLVICAAVLIAWTAAAFACTSAEGSTEADSQPGDLRFGPYEATVFRDGSVHIGAIVYPKSGGDLTVHELRLGGETIDPAEWRSDSASSAVVIAVDGSGAMADPDYVPLASAAVRAVSHHLRPHFDRTAVVTFASDAETIHDFADFRGRLYHRDLRISPSGPRCTWAGVAAGLQEAARSPLPARAVVLLATGPQDEQSDCLPVTGTEVAASARGDGVAISVIHIAPDPNVEPGALSLLAEETGGIYRALRSQDDLEPIAAVIAESIGSGTRLSFRAPLGAGRHVLTVNGETAAGSSTGNRQITILDNPWLAAAVADESSSAAPAPVADTEAVAEADDQSATDAAAGPDPARLLLGVMLAAAGVLAVYVGAKRRSDKIEDGADFADDYVAVPQPAQATAATQGKAPTGQSLMARLRDKWDRAGSSAAAVLPRQASPMPTQSHMYAPQRRRKSPSRALRRRWLATLSRIRSVRPELSTPAPSAPSSPKDVAATEPLKATEDEAAEQSEDRPTRSPVADRSVRYVVPETAPLGEAEWSPPPQRETQREPAPFALVGTTSGKYQLEAPLGKGGLGEVYRARDLILDRPVALKLLLGRAFEGSAAVDQLQREAGLAAQLNHPNAVIVHDITSFDRHAAIVMEYVAGQSLAETLAERGTLSDEEMAPILTAVAGALDAAHERGVVHGDVKPSNVLMGENGQIKLCDFGIARRVGRDRRGPWAGTPGYTAPEVEAGSDPDPRSDVYSLGALTVTMLTGKPDAVDELPPAYASVLRTALQPQPNVRCSRAGLLATAFRAAVERQQVKRRGRFARIRDAIGSRLHGKPDRERRATAATVAACADATMPMPFDDPDMTRPLDRPDGSSAPSSKAESEIAAESSI